MRQIHCLAAEPDACFLRISVSDDGQDVAYETMMLSHLRSGVRSLELRSVANGTRIELCSLLLDVTFNPVSAYIKPYVDGSNVFAAAQEQAGLHPQCRQTCDARRCEDDRVLLPAKALARNKRPVPP